jgi:hypothetical protein
MRWLVLLSAVTLAVVAACCSTSREAAPPPGAEVSPAGEQAGPNFAIEVAAPETVKVGQEALAKVVVTPRNGFKINLEYPSKLAWKAVPAGIVAEATLTKEKMRATEKALTVPVAFTAEGPGEKRFEGELRFSVCNKQTCQMPREQVSFATTAEGEPVAAPDAGPAAAAEAGGGSR